MWSVLQTDSESSSSEGKRKDNDETATNKADSAIINNQSRKKNAKAQTATKGKKQHNGTQPSISTQFTRTKARQTSVPTARASAHSTKKTQQSTSSLPAISTAAVNSSSIGAVARSHNESTLQAAATEDLSTARADEETVLAAVYGEEDFRRIPGVWGCAKLQVKVRPPDVEPQRIGSSLL
jgi:hypothetical protein